MSPGLKLLLGGEEEPENSITIDTPTGSLRHSRHSSVHSRMSTKKQYSRSPLTDEVFRKPSKDTTDSGATGDIGDTNTFSTFKGDTKKENSEEQPESSVVDGTPPDEGKFKRKSSKRESFLKRLFSRKRSSSSVLQSPPPAQRRHYTEESSNSRSSLKKGASLEKRIEFHQTALSVEVFDDDGTCLPSVREEVQQSNTAVVALSLHTTTVEINATSELIADRQAKVGQDAVKILAESVTKNVVNQAILVVENDINKSVATKDSKSSQPRPTNAPKVKKKKKRPKKQLSDMSAEEAVVTHNRGSTSYSTPFVETVKVEFKKVNQNETSSDYDTESNESNTDSDKLGIRPMEIEEFQEFGEDIDKAQEQREAKINHIYHHEKQSADENQLTDDHLRFILRTPSNPPTDQPNNGIPSTVVRAIHKDLQVLSESIDKDLDKLLNEDEEQDGLLKMDENASSSTSSIALEKLEEAQVISHVPLLKSAPEVAPKPKIVQNTDSNYLIPISTETTNIVRRLSSNFSEKDFTHAPNTSTATTLAVPSGEPSNRVKRLSSNFTDMVSDNQATKTSSFERKPIKKSDSIQERLKFFGEKIPQVTMPSTELKSDTMKEKPQQKDGKPSEMSKIEEGDVVMPLKSIDSTSLRRGSLSNIDRLKLDGLKGEIQDPINPSLLEAQKQKWRMSPLELSNKPGSPIAGRHTMDLGSPLTSHKLLLNKRDPKSLELFMNSANLDYLTKLHEKKLDDAKMLAIKRAEALLEEPTLSGQTAPEAFREILSQGNNKFIWCVNDTWYSWLETIDEFPLELDSEECYVFLHVS